MAKKWTEIAGSDDFKALPDEDKDVVRQAYFERVVAPEVAPEHMEATRDRFERATGLRSRSLPAGVAPSEASAGRGSVNPPSVGEDAPAPPQTAEQPLEQPHERQQVPPEIGGRRRPPSGGAGRGAINPPLIGEGRRPGESVLDMAARPPQGVEPPVPTQGQAMRDEAYLVSESVSPVERERQQRDLRYLRGTGVASPTPLSQQLGDRARLGLERTIGKGGAAMLGGVAGGLGELGKTGTGLVTAGADLVGAEGVSEFAQGASRHASGFSQAVTPQGEGVDKTISNVFSSITASLPFMVTGTAAEAQAFKLMFAQTALADYSDRRAQGVAPLPAAITATVTGSAEVLGEKFGFKEQTLAVRGLMDRMIAAGRSSDDMAKNAAKLLLKEVPGEQLTTAIQFLNDKYNVGGLTPEATLQDYFKQVVETAVTTMGQSAVVGGAPAAIDKARGTYAKAERAIDQAAGLLPKGPYRDAAEQGFVVDPPLVTDPPTQQRAKTIRIFEDVAAQHGIPSNVVKRAKEAADGMPAAEVGPFLNDMLQVLQRKGGVATPISAQASALLTAGPAEPLTPEELAKAKGKTPDSPAQEADARAPSPPATGETEEDFTGLSESTPGAALEEGAHQAATSPKNDLPEPSNAQKEAGNYQLGHVVVSGLDLSIENPEGSVRRDTKNEPPKWQNTMYAHYGYIKGTVGQDGDHIDAFVKPGTAADHAGDVFVIDQLHADGKPDEHKVMVGYASEQEARDAYLKHYPKGWNGLGAITKTGSEEFKAWLKAGDTSKPFATITTPNPVDEQPDVQPPAPGPASAPAAGIDQPGGSRGAVGLLADDGGGRRKRSAAAPAAGVPAPADVGRGLGRADSLTTAPAARTIAKVGVTPASSSDLELRTNKDGTLTPWLEGYELTDFENGDPLKIPAGTSDEDVLKAIKTAKSLGRRSKVFPLKQEVEGAAPASAPATPEAPATSSEEAPAAPEQVAPVPTIAEAKPEAAPPTLSDTEAFSGDFAAFEGKTVEQPVLVAETGTTAMLRMDAAKAMRALEARMQALKALKDCLEKPR